ncbi:MAG: thioredoxin domain-containing protein [Polyangiales bacterium]
MRNRWRRIATERVAPFESRSERARGSLSRHALWLAVAVPLLGASCGEKGNDATVVAPGAEQAPATGSSKVESVPGVDVSELTDDEQATWRSLVNDLLSPCGEPRSVGACGADANGCAKCRPAAHFLGRLVSEGLERSEIETKYRQRYGKDEGVSIDVTGAPVRGAPMAPITVIEFSDFECPFCGRAFPIVEQILREFQGKVRVVFLNYPLSGHVRAMPAARAAVAAGKQGKFWEMHDMLFRNQTALEDEDLRKYAQAIGLDVAKFEADLASPEVQAKVDADRAKGEKVNVQGTPTFFVNGRAFDESPNALPSYLKEELASQ